MGERRRRSENLSYAALEPVGCDVFFGYIKDSSMILEGC